MKFDQLTWWIRVWISPLLWPGAIDPAAALKPIWTYLFAFAGGVPQSKLIVLTDRVADFSVRSNGDAINRILMIRKGDHRQSQFHGPF